MNGTRPRRPIAIHPGVIMRDWWESLSFEIQQAWPFHEFKCLRAPASHATVAPRKSDRHANIILYVILPGPSVKPTFVRADGVDQWVDALDVVRVLGSLAEERLKKTAALRTFCLPFLPLPGRFAGIDVDCLGHAEICQVVGVVTRLVTIKNVGDQCSQAKFLLEHEGRHLQFVLQLVLVAILSLPRDSQYFEPLTQGYANLVRGLFESQLTAQETTLAVAPDLGLVPLPVQMACVPAVELDDTCAHTSFLGVDYCKIDQTMHLRHGLKGACRCDLGNRLPVVCILRPGTSPAMALVALFRMAEAECILEELREPDASVAFSVDSAGGNRRLTVWSLVADTSYELAADSLVAHWNAQLELDTLGNAGLLAPQQSLLPNFPALRRAQGGKLATLTDLMTEWPLPHLPGRQFMLLDHQAQAFDPLLIGQWAEATTLQYAERLRAQVLSHGTGHYKQFAEATGTTELYMFATKLVGRLLTDQLAQSGSQILSASADGAVRLTNYGASELWASREYKELETQITSNKTSVERFFYDLVGSGKIARSGTKFLQAEGHLSFCPDTLGWREWGAKYMQRSGHGLGSLVMHYRECARPQDALLYIEAWMAGRAKGGRSENSAPGTPPIAHKSDESADRIARLLTHAQPVAPGTAVNAYLRKTRGLEDAPTSLIEQNPVLKAVDRVHYTTTTNEVATASALLVLISDGSSLQRILVSAVTRRKPTDARITKLTLGSSTLSAHLQIWDGLAEPHICFVAEGPETALSVASAWPGQDVCCTFGCSRLSHFMPPSAGAVVVLCRENDAPDKQENTGALVARFQERMLRKDNPMHAVCVVSVWPAQAPHAFKDFNDVHQRFPGTPGSAEIHRCIKEQLARYGIETGEFCGARKRVLDSQLDPDRSAAPKRRM